MAKRADRLALVPGLLALAACAAIAGRPASWSNGIVRVDWTVAHVEPARVVLREGTVRPLASRLERVALELCADHDGDGRIGAGEVSDSIEISTLHDGEVLRFRDLELPAGTLAARLAVHTSGGAVSVVDLLRAGGAAP
jgi:hypothetical protein